MILCFISVFVFMEYKRKDLACSFICLFFTYVLLLFKSTPYFKAESISGPASSTTLKTPWNSDKGIYVQRKYTRYVEMHSPGAWQILAMNTDVQSFGLAEPAINMGLCVKLMSKCSLIAFWLYNIVDPLKQGQRTFPVRGQVTNIDFVGQEAKLGILGRHLIEFKYNSIDEL